MTTAADAAERAGAQSRLSMTSVQPCDLPPAALLRKYQGAGAYTDCYFTEIPGACSHATFVDALYTTALFKVERFILAWAISKPSTDAQAKQLAEERITSFAAWRVEARDTDQMLLADIMGRTKSWLMVAPVADAVAGARTRLYFGSAVVPRVNPTTGVQEMGFAFRALMGFHRLYSRLFLGSARRRVIAMRQAQAA